MSASTPMAWVLWTPPGTSISNSRRIFVNKAGEEGGEIQAKPRQPFHPFRLEFCLPVPGSIWREGPGGTPSMIQSHSKDKVRLDLNPRLLVRTSYPSPRLRTTHMTEAALQLHDTKYPPKPSRGATSNYRPKHTRQRYISPSTRDI